MAESEGLRRDERQRAQRFEAGDPKLAAALRFAGETVESRGHPSEEAFREVSEAGYSDEQIMEMIANIALTTFSNYMNEAIETELDVPEVERVHAS